MANNFGRNRGYRRPPIRRSPREFQPMRVRTPQVGELLGIVSAMYGGGRLLVACKDGKDRICRIPGKMRKKIWVKEGDAVIIKPWEIEGNKKGDIVWRYERAQVDWLRKKGFL